MQVVKDSLKAWLPKDVAREDIYFELSAEAQEEIIGYVQSLNNFQSIEQISFNGKSLHRFGQDIARLREAVDDGYGFAVIKPVSELSMHEQRCVSWAVTSHLGEPLVQNSEGSRLIHVYDRDRTKRIEQGAILKRDYSLTT